MSSAVSVGALAAPRYVTPAYAAAIRSSRRRLRAMALNALALLIIAVTLVFLSPDQRYVAAPMLAACELALLHFTVLWSRDGQPPVFEIGTLWVLATALYTCFPLAGFLAMDLKWNEFTDPRLAQYDFNAIEIGAFGWRFVAYFASFLFVYLAVRRDYAVKTLAFERPRRSLVVALILALMGAFAFKRAMVIFYGVDLDASYDRLAEIEHNVTSMPYVLWQFSHNVLDAFNILRQAAALLLLLGWRNRLCRYTLIGWLTWEAATTVTHFGQRRDLVLLLISVGLLYHRVVKPLTFGKFAVASAVLVAAFLFLGLIRMTRGMEGQTQNVLTSPNEFQALFTTAFDIHKRKELGIIGHIPWQIYAIDLYLPVPKQILPFEKIDPSMWYVEVIGQRDVGIGYMFGVMSQAEVGLDWIELVVRGALLGLLFALLHRWYVRHAQRLWPTLFYLFIGIWSYYTFRATTFWFVHFIIYQFIPLMAIVQFIAMLLRHVPGRLLPSRSDPA